CSLDIPAGVEGATIAVIHNGRDMYDTDGNIIALPFTADTNRAMDTGTFSCMNKVKLVTSAAQSGGDAMITANIANFTEM
ncbi:MAG TPA: hypothetical protein VF679_05230, partial [Pedobacter sp.]